MYPDFRNFISGRIQNFDGYKIFTTSNYRCNNYRKNERNFKSQFYNELKRKEEENNTILLY